MKNHLTRFLRSPGTNNLVVLTSEDIFNAKKIFMCRSIWRKELKNLSCSILGLYKGNVMTRKEIIQRGLCLI